MGKLLPFYLFYYTAFRRPPTNVIAGPHVVIANIPVRNLVPLHTTTESNSLAQPGEYV